MEKCPLLRSSNSKSRPILATRVIFLFGVTASEAWFGIVFDHWAALQRCQEAGARSLREAIQGKNYVSLDVFSKSAYRRLATIGNFGVG